MRDDTGCEDVYKLSTKSWCEYIDDVDEECSDSDDEYQVLI